MKVVVIRPCGRTAFELGGYCARAFARLGHEVMIFNFRHEYPPFYGKIRSGYNQMKLKKMINEFKPKLILAIKCEGIPSEMLVNFRNKLGILTANWWIDDPLWIKVSSWISPLYDYFFTNDPQCVEVHQKAGCPNVNFLTFGCDLDIHRIVDLSKDEMKRFGSDVCFSGAMVPQRQKMLEVLAGFDLKIWWPSVIQDTDEELRIKKRRISSSSPLFSRFTGKAVWGEELAKVFSTAKICLNIHAQGGAGTNMRTFEVTGCGGFLLCEFREALPALFKTGTEMVCFKDRDELREMVRYYLAHPEEREHIARRGQARAYKEHTYKHRMQAMLSLMRL